MKYLVFTLGFFLNTFGALAQITLNANDMPVIGVFIEQGLDTMPESNLQPGGTGFNTWDFSDLEDHETQGIHFRAPQNLPFSNQFPGVTIAVDDGNNFYQYLKLTNQSLQILGVAGNFQVDDTTFFSIAVPVTPPQTLLQFPATYNQAFDEDLRQVIQWPLGFVFDSIRIVSNIHRTVKIDAYGNMKSPAGDFNTLRVKEHAATRDSTFAYTGGFWTLIDVSPYPDTSVNFSWWGKINGYAFPLVEFEMDPTDIDHHVQFASWVKNISTSAKEQAAQGRWRLYPNPAREFVNFEWPENLAGGRLELYDLQGRLVVEKNITDEPEKLELRSLQPNMYVVMLRNKQGRIVGVKILEVR